MPPRPKSWEQLARCPRRELDRLTDEALARFVREELYPFCAPYRPRLEALGRGDGRVGGLAALAPVPPLERAEWLGWQASEREAPLLRPHPAGMRESWPFLRKLALSFAGARARGWLMQAYAPCLQLRAPGVGGELRLALSRSDVDALGEAGARLEDVAGFGPPTATLVNAHAHAPSVIYWQTLQGALRSGRRAFHVGADAGAAARAIAEEGAELLAARRETAVAIAESAVSQGLALASLRVLSIARSWSEPALSADESRALLEAFERAGSQAPRLVRTLVCDEARLALSECPGNATGFHSYPDLLALEVIGGDSSSQPRAREEGQLVVSTLAGRGTVLLRFRSGLLAPGGLRRDPCPDCGRSLPRIPSDCAPIPARD